MTPFSFAVAAGMVDPAGDRFHALVLQPGRDHADEAATVRVVGHAVVGEELLRQPVLGDRRGQHGLNGGAVLTDRRYRT